MPFDRGRSQQPGVQIAKRTTGGMSGSGTHFVVLVLRVLLL